MSLPAFQEDSEASDGSELYTIEEEREEEARAALGGAARAAAAAADSAAEAARALQEMLDGGGAPRPRAVAAAAAAAAAASSAASSAVVLLLARLGVDDSGSEEESGGEGAGAHAGCAHAPGEACGAAAAEADDAASEEEEDAPWVPGEVLTVTTGAAHLQKVLDGLDAGAAAAVFWHASWCEPSVSARAALPEIAAAFPGAAIISLDVGRTVANSVVAREKVLEHAAARRKGAKPILRSGGRFPCVTLHAPPSLQPLEELAGEGALARLRAALAAAGAGAGAATAAGPPAAAEVLTRGAAQLKEVLAAARDVGKPVLVAWTRDGAGGAAADAARAAAARFAGRLVAVVADAGATPANAVLAGALGITAYPVATAYRSMKLEARLAGAAADAGAVLRLAARAVAGDAAAPDDAPAPAAAAAAAAPAAKASSSSAAAGAAAHAPSNYDPPAAKHAVKGASKVVGGDTWHLYPKMPCLRCGCAWWTSEDWNARCVRCGWDCERGGYDDDSAPLPAHRPRWEALVAEVRAGRAPAWSGRRAG
jgi:hypothetical protein